MVTEGRLVPKQNEIRKREKKLLELGEGGQKLVADFVASLGTSAMPASRSTRTTWGRYHSSSGGAWGGPTEVTQGDLVSYLNGVAEDDYSEDTKRDIRLIPKKLFR